MPDAIRFAERAFLIVLSFDVIVRMAPAVESRPHLALFLFSELVGVVLILVQRRGEWTTSAFAVAVAFVGTAVALMVAPQGTALIPTSSSLLIVIIGASLSLLAKLGLGRSFGVIPANRGVRNAGVYRVVRHPMYLGYVVNQVGFLLLYFSLWNVAVYAVTWLAFWLRLREEEKFLMQDQAYKAYALKVRYRIVPGLI